MIFHDYKEAFTNLFAQARAGNKVDVIVCLKSYIHISNISVYIKSSLV